MSSLLQVSRVKYLIDEDSEACESLSKLYFCIYCLTLRSADTLQHEIDSHFCPQTLDSLPSADAAIKRNKSSTCWQCPACSHSLSTRASSTLLPSLEDPSKAITKKAYYQACNFCRWTSRSVGIQDKDIASGAWTEKTNPNLPRINQLMEYYNYLAQKEIAEQVQKKSVKKRGYMSVAMQLQQKYAGSRTAQMSKRHPAVANPLSSSLSALRLKDSLKEVTIEPSKTVGIDEIERLPDDIYTKPVDFTQVASLEQRLDQPSRQIEKVEDFWPRKSTMYVKRSLRCKKCDHNIIKPEYNSSSIKFKIHLIAVQHIPEVRVHKEVPLVAGESNLIALSLTNPTEHLIHVSLFPNTAKNETNPTNALVQLPTCDLLVSKFDEAAEYGSTLGDSTADTIEDDPSLIVYRRSNKIRFYMHCTPDSNLKPEDDVWISFRFKHEHYGSTSILQLLKGEGEREEPKPEWLTQTVFINIGKVGAVSEKRV